MTRAKGSKKLRMLVKSRGGSAKVTLRELGRDHSRCKATVRATAPRGLNDSQDRSHL